MKTSVVHNNGITGRRFRNKHVFKPVFKKFGFHRTLIALYREVVTAVHTANNVFAFEFTSPLGIFHFFTAYCPSALTLKILIYTAFIDVYPLFFRDF